MKVNGKLLGMIGGLMGLWTGTMFGLTALLGHNETSGVWFGLFGAMVGISCATIGALIHYLNREAKSQN